MLKMYAIPNCNTVKKARAWLEEHAISYEFHDYKKQGVSADLLDNWIRQVGWEVLVNRQGMTWRKLTDVQKAAVTDAKPAKEVMLALTSIIKRPVMVEGEKVIAVGFDEKKWLGLFNIMPSK